MTSTNRWQEEKRWWWYIRRYKAWSWTWNWIEKSKESLCVMLENGERNDRCLYGHAI